MWSLRRTLAESCATALACVTVATRRIIPVDDAGNSEFWPNADWPAVTVRRLLRRPNWARRSASDDAETYSVVDEIARRAVCSGAHVLGARRDELPDRAPLVAILRYRFGTVAR